MEAAVEVKKELLDKLNQLWVERQKLLKGRALGLKDALAAAVAAGDITQFTTAAEGVVDALQEKNREITKQLNKILANPKASALEDPALDNAQDVDDAEYEAPAAEPEATSRPVLPANFKGLLAEGATNLINTTNRTKQDKPTTATKNKSGFLAELETSRKALIPAGKSPIVAAGGKTDLLAQIKAANKDSLKSANTRTLNSIPKKAVSALEKRLAQIRAATTSNEGSGEGSTEVDDDEWDD